MKNWMLIISGLLAGLLVTGCAVGSQVTSNETYRANNFDARQMDQQGFAILPVTAGADVEGYRRPFGDALNETATAMFKNAIPWDSTMAILNEKGLVEEYQKAIQAYNETAILNQTATQKLADALGVQYLLYVRLAPPEKDSKMTYNIWVGATQTQVQAVSAFAKVWDARGDIAWEGNSTTSASASGSNYIKDSIADQCKQTADALIRRLAGLPPRTGS